MTKNSFIAIYGCPIERIVDELFDRFELELDSVTDEQIQEFVCNDNDRYGLVDLRVAKHILGLCHIYTMISCVGNPPPAAEIIAKIKKRNWGFSDDDAVVYRIISRFEVHTVATPHDPWLDEADYFPTPQTLYFD